MIRLIILLLIIIWFNIYYIKIIDNYIKEFMLDIASIMNTIIYLTKLKEDEEK